MTDTKLVITDGQGKSYITASWSEFDGPGYCCGLKVFSSLIISGTGLFKTQAPEKELKDLVFKEIARSVASAAVKPFVITDGIGHTQQKDFVSKAFNGSSARCLTDFCNWLMDQPDYGSIMQTPPIFNSQYPHLLSLSIVRVWIWDATKKCMVKPNAHYRPFGAAPLPGPEIKYNQWAKEFNDASSGQFANKQNLKAFADKFKIPLEKLTLETFIDGQLDYCNHRGQNT